MTTRIALLLAALSAAGCAETTAPAPAPVVAPPVYAPVYGARRHVGWQQFCEQSWSVPQASALVAARGADGWELVAMYNGVLCYKRPTGESPPTPANDPRLQRAPDYVPPVRDPGF
jgi:hypothetical protein